MIGNIRCAISIDITDAVVKTIAVDNSCIIILVIIVVDGREKFVRSCNRNIEIVCLISYMLW